MQRIDAHIHFMGDHPEAVALLQEMDLELFNIVVAHGGDDWWERQAGLYRQMAKKWPAQYAWCTSFDLDGWNDPDYSERVITELERDFADGALACKVWKNIGMEFQSADGSFIHIDDSRFDRILRYLADSGKPLLMHIGEPLACWRPLEPGKPHYSYYSKNPEWHMYGRTDMPSHEEIMARRDHFLERHPRLRVIGAHLGSLEYDVSEVARRFERYPNFAVDISARLDDLAYQDSALVRQFFLGFPDRVLFGTDMVRVEPQSQMTAEARKELLAEAREEYLLHFRYFENEGQVCVRGRETEGLALPPAILNRFYTENARTWYPGL
jgi:predicted TIM-barrel fold metal-dependent hydrolase